jgi:gem associated protein 8
LGDSSQYNWFWENYYSALEWQERHQVAYWRSRSIALEYENNLLHQYVQSLVCNDGNPSYSTVPKHHSKTSSNRDVHSPREKKCNTNKQLRSEPSGNKEHDPDEEFEFLVTEEMMDFFEQSIRHKMELSKLYFMT